MTRRVVTCSSWREAAADQADEFFCTLLGWLVLAGIGLGAMHLFSPSSATSTTQSTPAQTAQPAPQVEAKRLLPEPAAPAPVQDAPASINAQPQEGQGAVSSPSINASHSCWFVPLDDRNMQGESCRVEKRVNANGHTVYDLWNNQGSKRTVVLWSNDSAELIQDGSVQTGSWQTKDDGTIWISINGSWLGFQAV